MGAERVRRRARRPAAWSLLACLLLAACAPLPRSANLPTVWQPSPNFGERVPNFIILHYTGDDSAATALHTLSSRRSEVSAHYLIVRDGTIVQLVDERARAWHAGESRWGSTSDLNSASIGVELDNNGREPYAQAQIDALLSLLADLTRRYRIPAANILGHSDVAPQRKLDPGPLFPWPTLAANGFGLWCAAPQPEPPPAFDPLLGLRAIGYDPTDAAAAVRAFRTHFTPDDAASELTERDGALIQCLLQESAAGPFNGRQ
ncbi:MAG TPA: N-acetylmuramoyl-L-alanine amidase [Burkholderiaceae bacterium]|nr:N-acetylmuramoyl-L-alanine amidase [Burkholderiaceae bacterium]